MKLKSKNKAVKAVKPTTAPKAASESTPSNVITTANFDAKVSYVGRKIPTAAIRKEAVGLEIPKSMKTGFFLLITGDKPGELVHPVRYDGTDVYAREIEGVMRYGSIKAVNSIGRKGFNAQILTAEELIKRAKKTNKAVKLTRNSDKKEVIVALLNPITDQYFAGICASPKGALRVVNMEHVCSWNEKKDQYVNPQEAQLSSILFAIKAA